MNKNIVSIMQPNFGSCEVTFDRTAITAFLMGNVAQEDLPAAPPAPSYNPPQYAAAPAPWDAPTYPVSGRHGTPMKPAAARVKVPQNVFTYKVPPGLIGKLKVGTWVVVERSGFLQAGLVMSVKDFNDLDTDVPYEYKWIVQVVDTNPYEAAIASEAKYKAELAGIERQVQRDNIQQAIRTSLGNNPDVIKKFEETTGLLKAPEVK